MLVDDSAVVRGLIAGVLEREPDMQIVASSSNGEQGVASAARHLPDIVILDIEMPVMDGITALPKILDAAPGTRVLMCSTLTERNAEITLKALSLGASDCIAKPSNSSGIYSAGDFKIDIVRLVRGLGRKAGASRMPGTTSTAPAAQPPKAPVAFELKKEHAPALFNPSVLAIGSSTGGPQALQKTLSSLTDLHMPVIITQHMPATFTKILAQNIARHTGGDVLEGENGMPVENGKIYIAPGGFHMGFIRRNDRIEIALNQDPPENFCRPSVDVMLRSAQKIWGANKILTVMLTGMGQDGMLESRNIADAGGRVIAQDQDTSVVWGMPGAVATAGICSAVLPLQEIGPWIRHSLGKR